MNKQSTNSTPKKTVLITGCSSGIGYATAHYLREKGFLVLASCRKAEDCQRLEAEGFFSPLIDYADEETIQSGFARALDFAQTHSNGKIFAVFNNGAFACPGLIADMPTDAFREVFEANFFGWHSLTRLMLNHMQSHNEGRIVQCSSVLGFTGANMRATYVSSKYAIEGYTDCLRLELMGQNIHPILIQPGPIKSQIRQNSIIHFEKWVNWRDSRFLQIYENRLIPRLYSPNAKKDRFELSAEAVAKIVHKALTATKPRPCYFVTLPTYISAWSKRLFPVRLRDKLLMKA